MNTLADWLRLPWRWHGDSACLSRLDLSKAICVKENPVRQVYRVDGFYLKIDNPVSWAKKIRSRFIPKGKAEYQSALALAHHGIPVVEYLAWGECGSRSAVISREWEESESAYEFFYRDLVYGGKDPERFRKGFAAFLSFFAHKHILHPDLHLGNLLYQPAKGKFALVDVYGVGVGGAPDACEAQLVHLLLELRAKFSFAELVEFAASIPIDERTLENGLHQARWKLRHTLARRTEQLFAGYAKFSEWRTLPGGRRILILKDMLRRPMAEMERFPEGECVSPEKATEWIAAELFDRLDGKNTGTIVAFEPPGTLYRK